VQATITRSEGYVGLVARYGDEDNFIFTFWNPGGTLFLARIDGGGWVSMGTKSMAWPGGETHTLPLIATNSGTSVSVDGAPQLSSTYGGMGSHTSAGLFGRNTTDSLWDDISITSP